MASKLHTFILALVSLATGGKVMAQEALRPLNANINYFYQDLKTPGTGRISDTKNRSAAAGNLTLPFKEDFQYADVSSYPDANLWSDSSVYINTGHAIAPPSIGVATFDGLNKKGYPYTPALLNNTQSLKADTLTSKLINLLTVGPQTLQPTDSVALTFYYQARGNGDAPELNDSLIVDLYKPAQATWNSRVWSRRGNANPNTNDTVFKRAFIWVSDTAYLHDGFKFRFRNKATTNGDFDHWHVDYIYLNKGRSMIGDTVYDDLAFGYIPTPILNRYSAMPWQQYTPSERANNLSVFIRSNQGTTTGNLTYQYKMFEGNVMTHSVYLGAISNQLKPFKYFGWNNYPAHASAAFNNNLLPFTDSAEVVLQHEIYTNSITPTPDFFPGNDTVIQRQYFKNYYAFDDGSAEAAYYIYGAGVKIAQKFKVNVPDTLRALRIYFDPIGSLSTVMTYDFRINLWSDLGNLPGASLYQDSAMFPKYIQLTPNATPEYTLTTPIVIQPGEYYIGIQQKAAKIQLGIGFDLNLDHHNSLYFDSGDGWTQSQIRGSLMMRPVLGKKILPPVGINERVFIPGEKLCQVYPNPANEQLTIESKENFRGRYVISNLMGQLVEDKNIEGTYQNITTSGFANGVYLLQVFSNNTLVQQQKIVVQH